MILLAWFSNKNDQPAPQIASSYAGKPLLILLENYVLDCIGCLSSDKASTITTMVQRVYGGGDDWKATLRATLHLDDSLVGNLRQMWDRNQEIALQANQRLQPEDFAHMVADQNFSALID